MVDGRTLAFVSRSVSLQQLDRDATVLPLSPRLGPSPGNFVEKKPEDFITADLEHAVEERTRVAVETWWRDAPPGSFAWKGLNLAECFEYELRLVLRDLFKTDLVIDRALERVKPLRVITDVRPLGGAFPPYPYLAAIGSLLQARAGGAAWDLQTPSGLSKVSRPRGASVLGKGYLTLAGQQGLSQIRKEDSVIALGPYRDVYRPLAIAASREGSPIVAVTSTRAPFRASPRSGLFVTPISAFLEPSDKRQIKTFVGRARDAIQSMPFPELVGPKDHGIDAALRGHLASRFTEEIPDLVSLSIACERGLGGQRAAILMETSSPLAKAFVRSARSHGMAVTVLQHGVIAGASSYRQTEGDRIAAWGTADANWFREHLNPPVRVEATGNPRYDVVLQSGGSSRTRREQETSGRPVRVLFASQPFVQDRPRRSPWDRHAALQIAIQGTAQVGGAELVVKWHPAEAGESLPQELAHGTIRVARSGNTMRLVRDATAVLVISSTIALEAMLLRRSVIFLGPPDPESPFHPPEDGGGIRVRSAEELTSVLTDLIQNPAVRNKVLEGQEAFLQEHYASLDGRAAERLASFLRSG